MDTAKGDDNLVESTAFLGEGVALPAAPKPIFCPVCGHAKGFHAKGCTAVPVPGAKGVPTHEGDPVVLPPHYTRYKIEPIYFIMENRLDFETGCVVKYVLRAPFKHADGGLEDLKKARRYLDMMIAKAEGKTDYASR